MHFIGISLISDYFYGKKDEAIPSEQSISVEGISQGRTSKAHLPTQQTHLCKVCVPVLLKDILHQSDHQTYFVHKSCLGDTSVRDFSANLHQHQNSYIGENLWQRNVDRGSFVMSCRFYV